MAAPPQKNLLIPQILLIFVSKIQNMQIRKIVEVTCDCCGNNFKKPLSEFLRNQKLGRKNFCSRTCVGKNNQNNFGNKRSDYDISKHSSNRRDKFSGFRTFIRRAKSRNKHGNLTLEHLKKIWDKQQGRCIYTNILLKLPSKGINNPIYTASLDRIDSAKDYKDGNVQFISISINWMKGSSSHEQTKELILLIKNSGVYPRPDTT